MASEPDLRREIAEERRELTNAVAGTLVAVRTALRIRRHFRD